ncbi:MAG: energy transducer TonB, partial [Rhodocyclaceae bacterium]
PKPVYPALARRMGEEGRVVLRVHVDPNGRPGSIAIRTSSGSERLDQAATAAVARWRFVPARRGDTAVSASVLVPIVFNLTEQ